MSTPTFFTRSASGLVREISPFSTFVYNAYSINPILTLAFMVLTVPGFHPGASMIMATGMVALLVLPISFVYASLSTAMPRSGGDYVYVTRILHPALGFAANWNVSVWFAFYLGAPCVLFGKFGISEIFRSLAVYYSNPSLLNWANWAASASGGFILGSVILWVLLLLYMSSFRAYLTLQTTAFTIATVGVVAMIWALFLAQPSMYTGHIDSYVLAIGGRAHFTSMIEQLATNHGFKNYGFSFRDTLLILVWPYLGLSSCFVSAYFGGEVRNARRTQWISIAGAITFSAAVMVLLVWGLDRVVGTQLLGAISVVPPNEVGLAFTPLFSELISVLTSNLFLLLLIGVGVALWTYVWAPVNILIITRNILAWSLDRLVPQSLSNVSARWRSPVNAIILVGIVSQICVALYAFVPSFTLLTGVLGLTITFVITSIAAVAFPFRQKALFESTQGRMASRAKIFSLVGVLSVLCLGAILVSMLLDPVSGISLNPSLDAGSGAGIPFMMFLVNIAVFASGFVVYYVARAIQRRKGIDITLAYREIPPE
jgi:APA family basic amino acid/polyamine antiporter